MTKIGARLTPGEITDALVTGAGIMPGYSALREEEPEKFRHLVAFLSALD